LLIAIFLVTAASTALYTLGRLRPEFIENVYRPFSRLALYWISYAASFVPFSVAEILIYIAAACALVAAVRLVYVMITGPRRIFYLLKFVLWATLIAAVFCLFFYLLWGLNYNAEPLEIVPGVKERETGRLVELNEHLSEQANYYSLQIERDGDGNPAEQDFAELAQKVAQCFSGYTGRNEFPVKYILASKYLSYMRISGIFIPYTGEANINRNNIPSDLPFCMAHEMAHRYAIAREAEANFFSFYVLKSSDDPFLAYSAYLAAIRYCQNALFNADYGEFVRVYGRCNDYVKSDLMQYGSHWDKYDGKLADISYNLNDIYLTLQGESDGAASYNSMVDYMLAWFDSAGIQ
jgi:hypothetical protein